MYTPSGSASRVTTDWDAGAPPRGRVRRPPGTSAEAVAGLRGGVGIDQQHGLAAVRAEGEHLRTKRSDLARGEVHDREHEPTFEVLARIVRDLRRGTPSAQLGTEVDRQL